MAAGQTIFTAGAMAGVTQATGGASLDTRTERPVLDFTVSVDDNVFFSGVLPAHYSGGDLDVAIHWMAASATTLVCRWGAQFERLEAGGPDLDGLDFQVFVFADTTTAGTAGVLTETTITMTALDSAVAGDSFRIRIQRNGIHANDTMANDAELLDISVTEA